MAHGDILFQIPDRVDAVNTQPESFDVPDARSWEFAEDHVALPESVRAARDEAILAGMKPISSGVAAALTLLAATTSARHVVEVGTNMGASALALFQGMAADGILTSIDALAENQLPARRFLLDAGLPTSRFRLIAGNPLDVLPKLNPGTYDVMFINGDKLEYVEYVAEASKLLRPGGLLVVHDALWHNQVADPDSQGDEAIIIREALEAITAAETWIQCLLPVGNGLLVAVRAGE